MTDHLDIAATAAGFTIDANPSHAPGPFQNRAGSLDDAVMRAADDEITGWAGYAPTPLHDLPEIAERLGVKRVVFKDCLLYTSPSPRDAESSRMPSSA